MWGADAENPSDLAAASAGLGPEARQEWPLEVCEAAWRLQEAELSALRALFMEDLLVSLALVVTLTRAYPEEPPGIEVRWDGLEEGLSESRYPELYGVLQRQARENLGSFIISEIIETARAWLIGRARDKIVQLRAKAELERERRKALRRNMSSREELQNSKDDERNRSMQHNRVRQLIERDTFYGQAMKETYRWDYEIFTREQILALQRAKEALVQETIGFHVPPAVVRVFLHHYRWDPQALIRRYRLLTASSSDVTPASPVRHANHHRPHTIGAGSNVEAASDCRSDEPDYGKGVALLYAEVGLPYEDESHTGCTAATLSDDEAHVRAMAALPASAACGICMDEFTIRDMTALSCGHWFCNECYGMYLVVQITDGASDAIRCASFKCPYIMDPVTVGSLVSREVYRKFVTFAAERYIETDPTLFRCRGARCANVIHLQHHTKDVACPCGHISCTQCGEFGHFPIPCSIAKWFHQTYGDRLDRKEEATLKWLINNTKDCPKCSNPIEKNGGCNHMTCRAVACGYEFCWICGRHWGSHVTCGEIRAASTAAREVKIKEQIMADDVGFLGLQRAQYTVLNAFPKIAAATSIKAQRYLEKRHDASAKGVRSIKAALHNIYMGRYLLAQVAKLGISRPTMCKPLMAAMINVKHCIELVNDFLDMPAKQLSVGMLDNACLTLRARVGELVGAVNKILVAEAEAPLQLVQAQELIVRRMCQQKGGKRIACPHSLEMLLAEGSRVLGITATVARTAEDNRRIEPGPLPFFPERTVIYILTTTEAQE